MARVDYPNLQHEGDHDCYLEAEGEYTSCNRRPIVPSGHVIKVVRPKGEERIPASREVADLQHAADAHEQQAEHVEDEDWGFAFLGFGEHGEEEEDHEAGADLGGEDGDHADGVLCPEVDIAQGDDEGGAVGVEEGDVLRVGVEVGGEGEGSVGGGHGEGE